MRSGRYLFVVAASILQLSGCNETFEPKGPYAEKVVIYSILTTMSDTQYVRIYRTYDPSGFNPLEVSSDNAIDGAQVSVTGESETYQFHDTTIVRSDKSRYQTDIKAYVAYGFSVVRGKTYSLRARIGDGSEYTTSINIPADANILTNGFNSLAFPHLLSDDDLVSFRIQLSSFTQGFIGQVFLEYDLFVDSTWTRTREEIPLGLRNFVDCRHFDSVYPQLQRRSGVQQEQLLYQVLNYKTILRKIWNVYGSNVRMKQVVFELMQFEPNLYNYYNIAHGFNDEFSIRTDVPDFTNILGAHGVFGAWTRQSLAVSIPETTGMSLSCGN